LHNAHNYYTSQHFTASITMFDQSIKQSRLSSQKMCTYNTVRSVTLILIVTQNNNVVCLWK